jgi:Tol biopolymer transport system component
MALPTGSGSVAAPNKILASTRQEMSPAYSPDGKRIAFSSNRTGVTQIWVADADGSNPMALTNFTRGVAGAPQWSPDGQTIVFDARPDDLADIYSARVDGGTLRRLTDHPAEDHVPCYSADGRWIYFASTRAAGHQLFRMPSDGGEAVQITHKGGTRPIASPDGKWVYFSRGIAGIWRVPVKGGEETQFLEVRLNHGYSFRITATGIYFAAARDPVSKKVPLKLYRFADRKTVELGHFDKTISFDLSVSPDEKWMLYSQLDSSVDDLMLVENFR